MSFFDNMAICIISYRVNFLAEAALKDLRSPADTYVVHTGKNDNLIKSFVTPPNVKHIVFDIPMPEHGITLNQICFDNPSFAKIFEKYKWVMFLDHDTIIKHPDIFWWSVIKEKLNKDTGYCMYSIYDTYTTSPFFIIWYQRLRQIIKNKRYDSMHDIGFTTLRKGDLPTKVECHLVFNQVKRYDSWFDTGRAIIWLCENVYNIPHFRTRCEVLTDIFHLGSFWNCMHFINARSNDDELTYITCMRNIVEKFQFHSQYDIDRFLSCPGVSSYFQRSPFNLQVESLPQGFSFVTSPMKIDYVGSEL